MRTAKGLDIPMFIVGHVNKEGSIAGPKVLEHIVDTVLHFEGDKQMSCRILRAVKNRYGSTNEIGVFEMTDKGLTKLQIRLLCCFQGVRKMFRELASPVQLKDQDQFLPKHRDLPHKAESIKCRDFFIHTNTSA